MKKIERTYIVTNIEYDTDDKNGLPEILKITVPNYINDKDEIDEYISDEISHQTGFCHKGFAITLEKDC